MLRRIMYIFVCLVVFSCQITGHADALTQAQKEYLRSGVYYTDAEDEDAGCGPGSNVVVSTTLPASIPKGYAELFTQAAHQYDTNPQFLAALFLNEHSNTWYPFSGPWSSSSVGASGPFQFMPGTWDGYKVDGNNDGVADIQNMYDAAYSAANYLNRSGISTKTPLGDLVSPFTRGTFVFFSAVYNWGGGNVQRHTNAGSPLSAAPAETENYMTNTYNLISSGFTKGSDKNGPITDKSNGQTTSVGSSGSTAAGSGCSAGVVSGSIVQTALNLAWDTKGHSFEEADAKSTYQTVMPQINGATDAFPFSDCGVFVSTVMIASGADKDYPKRSTIVQKQYLEGSTKYEVVTSQNTSNLKPGDIFVNTQHTYIYVGPQASGGSIVAASWHVPKKDPAANKNGHVPEIGGSPYFFQDGTSGEAFEVFRLKATDGS